MVGIYVLQLLYSYNNQAKFDINLNQLLVINSLTVIYNRCTAHKNLVIISNIVIILTTKTQLK